MEATITYWSGSHRGQIQGQETETPGFSTGGISKTLRTVYKKNAKEEEKMRLEGAARSSRALQAIIMDLAYL